MYQLDQVGWDDALEEFTSTHPPAVTQLRLGALPRPHLPSMMLYINYISCYCDPITEEDQLERGRCCFDLRV